MERGGVTRGRRRAVGTARRLAQVATVMVILAPVSYRLGAGLLPAFALLSLGMVLAGMALVIAPIGWVFARRDPEAEDQGRSAAVATLLAAVALVVPVSTLMATGGAPPIHHITTDPVDPPRFEAVVPLRGTDANPIEYPGAELAAIQRDAYPDIQPLYLDAPPSEAFRQSMEVARALGWAVAEASESEGRIEATDTTRWFGFVDDVVVRIRPSAGGSRVDVRSVSRVGVGDLGANAARIRTFASRLAASLD